MIVYKATNTITGKCYIGKTRRTLKQRITEHKYGKNKSNYYFSNAINKYGIENFNFTIIDKAETDNELKLKERFWISFFRACEDGYNILSGESSWDMIYKERTEEQKEYLAIVGGGKPFLVFNLNGILIARYVNKGKASRELGVSKANITACLKNRGARLKDYIFIYEHEHSKELLENRINRVQKKIKYAGFKLVDKKGNYKLFIRQFQIAEYLNVSQSRVGGCVKGRDKTIKGFRIISFEDGSVDFGVLLSEQKAVAGSSPAGHV